MALSGSFSKNIGDHWRLLVEWSATQNIANNQSTVTTKFYWVGLTEYSAVYASSTRSGTQTTDGHKSTFSATAGLSAYQKKLLHTKSRTVTHNANGTKSLSLSASFDIGATLAGTYYGNQTLSASITLNSIPRKSSLDNSPDWIAGDDKYFRIDRASTSFTHKIEIYFPSTASSPFKTINNVGYSTTVNFTNSDNGHIFENLLGYVSNRNVKIRITTYSGSSNLGYNDYTGSILVPNASYMSASRNFDIGDSVPITISRANSQFTHTVRIKVGGTTIATLTGIGQSTTWNPTTTQINNMYDETPNSNTVSTEFEVETYYDGHKVNSTTDRTGTAKVVDAAPIFNSSQIAYYDQNSQTVAVTGDNSYIIQNRSDMVAQILSAAQPQKGASMDHYQIEIDGRTYTRSSIGIHAVGSTEANNDITLRVFAIDSRGNSKSSSITVKVVPYATPSLSTTAKRQSGFEDATTLTAKGSISGLDINGSNKNLIQSLMYRYKETTETTWSSWTTLSNINLTFEDYSADPIQLVLPKENSYNIEYRVVDIFQTVTVSRIVDVGIPLYFIDSIKGAMGINCFPADHVKLEIAGNTRIQGNLELVSASEEGYLTFERTATHLVKWDIDLGWGGFGVRNLTDEIVGFHIDREGNMRIGDRGGSHPEKLTVGGRVSAIGYYAEGNASSNGFVVKHSSYTNADNIATVYSDRNEGHIFRVRSHGGGLGYRNDFMINSDGSATFLGLVTASDMRTSNVLNPNSNILYLGANQETRIVDAQNTNNYSTIAAATYRDASSAIYKDNIIPFDGYDEIGILMDIDVFKYHLKSDLENGIYDKPRIGFMAEMVHQFMRDEDGVNNYSITSILWKVNQNHENRVRELENKVVYLEDIINQMLAS